jgi:hypothetical protein
METKRDSEKPIIVPPPWNQATVTKSYGLPGLIHPDESSLLGKAHRSQTVLMQVLQAASG